MRYVSTRGAARPVSSLEAVLQGIAPDGGLYMPEAIPVLDCEALMERSTQEMAVQILSALLPDFKDMAGIVERAYCGKFETEDLTPLVKVGGRYVLELFRGPTSAFKDVALSVLPQLMTAARRQLGIRERIIILTATSGDTGKAALEGFHDVEGTGIVVFYPAGGVSAIQRAQMVTQEGSNVRVAAIRGNFDDAQTGVKEIFATAAASLPAGVRLSSANSINIGRLAPQVVYYFRAYAELLRLGVIRYGEAVDFTVPTGNFGDILAGYFAKCMGLPVGKLYCASNRNDVLTQFIRTGFYDRRRPFYKTDSPSMDILVSSNLERLLYLLSDGDTSLVSGLMMLLKAEGAYQLPKPLLEKLQAEFAAEAATDAQTAAAIGQVWSRYRYCMDTHTGVAWHCAEQLEQKAPNVVLSTASPFKFPAAVLKALGQTPQADDFALLAQLQAVTGLPIPKNLAALSEKPELHTRVIEKDQMAAYVAEICKEQEELK